MWKTILAWLAGVSKKVLSSLAPYLMSEGAAFVADAMPLALKAVENAAHLDLDGDDKFDHAQEELQSDLSALGLSYRSRWINQAIELAYEQVAGASSSAPLAVPE
jgi:hypothetical protein